MSTSLSISACGVRVFLAPPRLFLICASVFDCRSLRGTSVAQGFPPVLRCASSNVVAFPHICGNELPTPRQGELQSRLSHQLQACLAFLGRCRIVWTCLSSVGTDCGWTFIGPDLRLHRSILGANGCDSCPFCSLGFSPPFPFGFSQVFSMPSTVSCYLPNDAHHTRERLVTESARRPRALPLLPATGFLKSVALPWVPDPFVEGVPKSWIGGSGPTTPTLSSGQDQPVDYMPAFCNTPPFDARESLLYWSLGQCGAFLVPFARSLLLLLLLSLVRLWLRPWRASSTPLGRIIGLPLLGVPIRLPASLGVACPDRPILCWDPWRDRRGRLSRRRHSHRRNSLMLKIFGFLYGFLQLPAHTTAVPVCALGTWGPFVTGAHAMARPPDPDNPLPQPYVLQPEPLGPSVTLIGTCDVDVPWNHDGDTATAHRRLSFEAVPWSPPPDDISDPCSWIGVTLYTPHYQPQTFAVNVAGHPSPAQAVLDLVTHHGPSPANHLFNTVVPALPQRFAGSVTLVRCHSAIRHMGHIGFAAVLVDLTRVGHRYFSATLPKQLTYEALETYLQPLVESDDRPLLLYIGLRKNPWPPAALVTLHDGDVITVVRDADEQLPRHRYDQLFLPEARWIQLGEIPQPECNEKWCVMYRDKRFTINFDASPVDNTVALVSNELDLPPNSVVMCTFPVCDLDVQGEFCPVAVAVMDVAAPAVSRAAVRDIFVFLDFRPLGSKPRFLYTNVPTVHIPSILARFGIELPLVYKIGVYGGTRQGNEVHLDGHATLLFHFLEASAAPSSSSELSDGDAQALEQESPNVSSHDGRIGVGPARGVQLFEDVTIPAGHSWNAEHDSTGISHTVSGVPRTRAASDDDPPPWDVVLTAHETADPGPARAANTAAPTAAPSHLQSGRLPEGPMMLPEVRARAISTTRLPAIAPPTSQAASIEVQMRILIFIFAPDFVPDILCLHLTLPAAVDNFLAAVPEHRTGTWYESFPKVVPVKPQPCEEYAICVAAPAWLQDRAIILVDSRRMDERLFAITVPTALSRESLILAAGFGHSAPVRVYVHGLLQPLAAHQRIALLTGMTITISPNIIGAPATFDLGTRLQSTLDWNPHAEFPCAPAYPGSHFYVLTDGMPAIFEVRPFRRASFREDLAQSLLCAEHSLLVRAFKA